MKKLKVINAKGEQVKPTSFYGEMLAHGILNVSNGMKSLLSSGLKEDTIALLVQHQTKVSLTDIRAVLKCLPQLEHIYLSRKT